MCARMCVTTINDRNEKYLLIWKKNKKRVWRIWSEIGEKENDVITYYNLTKKKEILFKTERRGTQRKTIPRKQSRFAKEDSAWGKMAMENDICLCVL